jgi:hypothetical protein
MLGSKSIEEWSLTPMREMSLDMSLQYIFIICSLKFETVKNMVMSPMGLGLEKKCAGEAQ